MAFIKPTNISPTLSNTRSLFKVSVLFTPVYVILTLTFFLILRCFPNCPACSLKSSMSTSAVRCFVLGQSPFTFLHILTLWLSSSGLLRLFRLGMIFLLLLPLECIQKDTGCIYFSAFAMVFIYCLMLRNRNSHGGKGKGLWWIPCSVCIEPPIGFSEFNAVCASKIYIHVN